MELQISLNAEWQSLRSVDRKAITAAAHGLDQAIHPGRFQCGAQAANMHVHCAFLDEYLRSQYLIEQLRAAIHALRMGHEKMQQTKLRRSQLHTGTFCSHAMRRRRQLQPARRHRFIQHGRNMTAQNRAYPCHQLSGRKRLGDVIVRAGLQPQYLVALITARGQHDDGDILAARIGTKLFRQNHTAGVRQHPVQQDQVRHIAAYLMPRAKFWYAQHDGCASCWAAANRPASRPHSSASRPVAAANRCPAEGSPWPSTRSIPSQWTAARPDCWGASSTGRTQAARTPRP